MQVNSYTFQTHFVVTPNPNPDLIPDPDPVPNPDPIIDPNLEPDPSVDPNDDSDPNVEPDLPLPSFDDWEESFNEPGWSGCEKDNTFITGFYRLNPPDENSDPISSLQKAQCSISPSVFRGQNATCKSAYWGHSMKT